MALWSWRLGGAVAAVVATTFFAFDPNFLAHASLVTSDVPAALMFAAVMFAAWRVGQNATVPRILALIAAVPVAVLVKQSMLLTIPVVALLLIMRAWLAAPWKIAGRELKAIGGRVSAVAVIGLAMAAAIFVGIWLCYGFRFSPTPDPTERFDLQTNVIAEVENRAIVATGQTHPSAGLVSQFQPSAFTHTMLAINTWHLLPQAFVDGLMHAHAESIVRRTYLLGDVSLIGKWYYFPLTILVKTPLATLFAALAGFALFLRRASRRRAWDWMCLVVPPAIYLAVAISSSLNLGIRHILPIYPFVFVGIGIAFTRAYALRPDVATWTGAIAALGLLAESFSASPFYLPFFNVSAGGSRGGVEFLGDSNLDWGQGLKVVARWQKEHGNSLVYLGYAGSVDPKQYGIQFISLVRPEAVSKQPEYVIIGASMLQGITLSEAAKRGMDIVRTTVEPLEVLGGCMYVYRSADVLPLLSRFGG